MIVRDGIYEKLVDHVDQSTKEKCFASRDAYWKCLDDNNDNEEVCQQQRMVHESLCPDLWVSHYRRRRSQLKKRENR